MHRGDGTLLTSPYAFQPYAEDPYQPPTPIRSRNMLQDPLLDKSSDGELALYREFDVIWGIPLLTVHGTRPFRSYSQGK